MRCMTCGGRGNRGNRGNRDIDVFFQVCPCIHERERERAGPLRPPVERTGVSEAGLERAFHGVLCNPSSLTVRVHLDAEQRSPLDARLVLFCDAIVAPQQLHLEVAVTRQAGSPNLAARVMLAVCPVEVLSSAESERASERTDGRASRVVRVRAVGRATSASSLEVNTHRQWSYA